MLLGTECHWLRSKIAGSLLNLFVFFRIEQLKALLEESTTSESESEESSEDSSADERKNKRHKRSKTKHKKKTKKKRKHKHRKISKDSESDSDSRKKDSRENRKERWNSYRVWMSEERKAKRNSTNSLPVRTSWDQRSLYTLEKVYSKRDRDNVMDWSEVLDKPPMSYQELWAL